MLAALMAIAPLILLILAILALIIWAIKKLVHYYQTHICDWAAKRLAKCVPASQCAASPLYIQAKRCPQTQVGCAHNRPIITVAAAPHCEPAPVVHCAPVETVSAPVVKKVVKTIAPAYTQHEFIEQ